MAYVPPRFAAFEWSQVDFALATLHVRRVKSGKPSTHPIRGDEMRALRKLRREAPKSPFMFVSERGGPFTTDSFNWLVKRAGRKAELPFQAHAQPCSPACLWLCAGKCRSRYPLVTGLPRAQEYPAHGAVHRVGGDALQGLLALTIHGTSQKLPDFRQQANRIVASSRLTQRRSVARRILTGYQQLASRRRGIAPRIVQRSELGTLLGKLVQDIYYSECKATDPQRH
jgi:hypothetical protein